MNARWLLCLLLSAGCLQITPADGALQCSTVGNKCPSNYYCASDRTCWKNGHTPPVVVVTRDMSVPGDMAMSATGDMTGAGGDMAQPMAVSCMMPSDCPASPSWCLLVACIGGSCSLVAQAAATTLPANLQVPNDCQSLQCNASGGTQSVPDDTDTAIDPTGGCNTASCSGGSIVLTPTLAGTACTQKAAGICNGKGTCGLCKPNDTKCDGMLALATCATDGSAWTDTATCQSCTGNNCVAPCVAANYPQCNGNSLITCVGGSTVSNGGCTYGCCATTKGCNVGPACSNGAPIGGSVCDGNGTQVDTCDGCATGGIIDCTGTATPYCNSSGGAHCASCKSGTYQCCTVPGTTTAGSQQCDVNGNWGGCAACSVPSGAVATCTGAGACGCSAVSPCAGGTRCGSNTNACGVSFTCTCKVGFTCETDDNICIKDTTIVTTKVTTCTKTVCQ